ncbi:MAG: DNA methyltransferase, partial [Pyrinomonadaceae bacterium]
AELMGNLHDRLEEIGYVGHPLEVYLVRLLFCLFAEDTTIFEKQQFQDYIEQRTNEDGSDLAAKLQELFQVLNTPKESRFSNLDEQLADFPYVNGKLFEESLPMTSFDSKMRQQLITCCHTDWSKISPAIFGSMFQSVMNPVERRNLGAHYTSETNILKLIKPLFLDDLWKEFEKVKGSRNQLQEFHQKLANLRFLDPACGCGNFLVITYRELRLLEIEILRELNRSGQQTIDVSGIIWLDVDMMSGIEYEEFPARIAEVAMWLIDHQMNMLISNEFGQYFVRLPLRKSANIVHGNALRIDWETVVAKEELSYILGNPPFVGAMIMNADQRQDMSLVFNSEVRSYGVLDYVTAWHYQAAKCIQGTKIQVAFVSTNSIVQGEQTNIFWAPVQSKLDIRINFAHRTFKWRNEAKGNAAVFCVIVGFATFDKPNKRLFEYEDIKGEPHELQAKNINAYLVDAKDLFIHNRSNPICETPKMSFGSMPRDGGNLIFSLDEKNEFLQIEPMAEKWIRPYTGAQEFINGYSRYCLWLVDIKPDELKKLPMVLERVRKVRDFRLASSAASTRKFAQIPALFCQIAQPATSYLLVPRVSSERRKFIPIGYLESDVIANDQVLTVPKASLFHLGVLTSSMHMAWVKTLCGRLKSDYRYSKDIVYNNFPWPDSPAEKHIKAIESAAERVLQARTEYPNSSLADLYDPIAMPPPLAKAHSDLDKAVDHAYRVQPFTSEANRMVFLFELYEKYTASLFPINIKTKRAKNV